MRCWGPQKPRAHLDPQLENLQDGHFRVWRQLLDGHQQPRNYAVEPADFRVPASGEEGFPRRLQLTAALRWGYMMEMKLGKHHVSRRTYDHNQAGMQKCRNCRKCPTHKRLPSSLRSTAYAMYTVMNAPTPCAEVSFIINQQTNYKHTAGRRQLMRTNRPRNTCIQPQIIQQRPSGAHRGHVNDCEELEVLLAAIHRLDDP